MVELVGGGSVINGAYPIEFLQILNIEGHPNCITGSRVNAIFLNGWILPIDGVSLVEGLQSTGLPRLV